MECCLDTPLGGMLLRERDGAVAALRFLAAGEGEKLPSPETALARRVQNWLNRYFGGERPWMDLPLAPEGTAFQRCVWEAAREIPVGETRSYGQLASRVGCRSARAVGAALGKNPVWILIPCHRVVGADGTLTGYAGGLDKKAALLAREKSV